MNRRNSLSMIFSLSLLAASALPAVAFAQTPEPVPAEHAHAKGTPTVVEGRFASYLTGPKGKVHGIVLENGTVVRIRPIAFVKDAPELKVGDVLRVEGLAVQKEKGTMIHRALVQRAGVTIADARNLPPREHRHEK
jgi:hypothetical protein